MAGKPKKKPNAGATDAADLKARVERARREGRYQHALDLVKQLHRAVPTPEHFELVKDTYLKRGDQLREQGHPRDAAAVLEAAGNLQPKDAAWLARVTDAMTRTGDVARSMALLQRLQGLGDPAALASSVGKLADAAVLAEKGSKAPVPAELQADLRLVQQALADLEAGRDEPARAALQGIGLRSPFAEWKLLVRGLMAYYASDDARAVENWSRLSPDRAPFRIAAPFRAAVDPAFLAAQPPASQSALKRQLDQAQPGSLKQDLAALRVALADPERAGEVFGIAERVVPALQRQAPHLVPRLASVLYWAALSVGPDSVRLYRRTFGGAPADDPSFHRLNALGYEGGEPEVAHRHWQSYEAEIAAAPQRWPGEVGALARALIWLRMGDNAAAMPTAKETERLPRFLRDLPGLPRPLSPPADRCLRRALELAPRLAEAHEALFHYLARADRAEEAIGAAERMLELFPDRVEMLTDLADLHTRREEYDAALRRVEQAVRHNPLDRALRQRLSLGRLAVARQQTEAGRFDEARAHLQAALPDAPPGHEWVVLGRAAALELKAGDQARADEALARARAQVAQELQLTYLLLVESNRLKLPNPVKTRYTRAFNQQVAAQPDPAVAAALLSYAAQLAALNVTYHGQKTHTKKLIDYATRGPLAGYTEEQLAQVLGALCVLGPPARWMQNTFYVAQRRYPDNPRFYYLEVVWRMGNDPDELAEGAGATPRVSFLLHEAGRLARARPADEPGIQALLDDVSRRQAMLRVLNPLGALFESFGGLDDLYGPEDDDDDEYGGE